MQRDRSLLVLPVAMLGLVAALSAGSLRLMGIQGLATGTGWLTRALGHHGELMVFGFLAPLIMLERYSATRQLKVPRVVRVLPWAAGVGALLVTTGYVTGVGDAVTLGVIGLGVAATAYLFLLAALSRWTAQPEVMHMLALATVGLLAALALTRWISPIQNMGLVMLLLAFPVLTVLGERVELGAILNPHLQRYGRWFVPWLAASVLFFLAAGSWPGHTVAPWLLTAASLTWFAMGGTLAWGERWLWRREGDALYRYLSRNVMVAYGWLLAGALMIIVYSFRPDYKWFDAATHAVALGFVFGMILAHAPVILPALLGREPGWDHLPLWPLVVHSAGVIARVGGRLFSPAAPSGWVTAVVGLSWVPVVVAMGLLGVILIRGWSREDSVDGAEVTITMG